MEIRESRGQLLLVLQEYEKFESMYVHDILFSMLQQRHATTHLPEMRLLGLDYAFCNKKICASHFIGADWVDRKKGIAMEVRPKIDGIDLQRMFMYCFKYQDVGERLDDVFYVRTDDKPIELEAGDFALEPLIIIYFLQVVNDIVRKGLRRDYVSREELLEGKVKGKILMAKYIKHGIAKNRKDRVECRLDEFSVDCLDNRILKASLRVIRTMIDKSYSVFGESMYAYVCELYNRCMPAFADVSDNVSQQDLAHIQASPMFRNYASALKMSKSLLMKQNKGLSQHNGELQMVPPFVINMSLLFERYVYAMLRDQYGDSIQKPVHGVPYEYSFVKVDDKNVIGCAYDAAWSDAAIGNTLQRLTACARNNTLRKSMGISDSEICRCLVMFPDKYAKETVSIDMPTVMEDFVDCFKMGVRLAIR